MKNDHKPTGRVCPLCGKPTTMEWIDCGHKEEGCISCNFYGDEIFEFGRKVKERFKECLISKEANHAVCDQIISKAGKTGMSLADDAECYIKAAIKEAMKQ